MVWISVEQCLSSTIMIESLLWDAMVSSPNVQVMDGHAIGVVKGHADRLCFDAYLVLYPFKTLFVFGYSVLVSLYFIQILVLVEGYALP